jgi:predicted nucleic acid-binding protein
MRVHLDTDFLVRALASQGPERRRLFELAASRAEMQMSSLAWYEFVRGPRSPEQVAVARSLFEDDGIIPFSDDLAELAAETFRQLGSPRRRSADIAIGITALEMNARLLSCNADDFAGIPSLKVEAVRPESAKG